MSRIRQHFSALQRLDRQRFETIVTSSAFVITNGLMAVNMLLLSWALSDDGRGAVAAAYGNTVVIGWVFHIGMPTAAGYFAKDANHRAIAMSAWTMSLVAAVPIGLLMIPFYRWQLGGIAFTEGGVSLQRWYLAFIALQLFNGPFLSAVFRLRGIGDLRKFNFLLALPHVLVTTGYAALFISGNMTVNSALASTFIMLAAGWSIGLTATNSWPGRGFSRTVFSHIRSYSFRTWFGNLSAFASFRIDQLLLVNFVPLGQLGVYAVAAAISMLSGPIARGIGQGLLPFIRNAATDAERLERIASSIRNVATISLAALAVLALTASFGITLILPDKFAGAIVPLLILLPGAWAADVTQVLTVALNSFNRPEFASKAQIGAALTTAIGLLLLLPRYGIVGAAVTTSLSYWTGLIATAYFWRRTEADVRMHRITGDTDQLAPLIDLRLRVEDGDSIAADRARIKLGA